MATDVSITTEETEGASVLRVLLNECNCVVVGLLMR